jgi:hypothetical protein
MSFRDQFMGSVGRLSGALAAYGVAALVVLLAIGQCANDVTTWKEKAAEAELGKHMAEQRAKGLAVELTSTKIERDSYKQLGEIDQALHGKLIAGAVLKIGKRDTVFVNRELPTVTHTDSTRTATFRDSTFAGVVSGTVTAPRCCAPLRLDSLRVARPEFRPEIAFVRVGGKVVAVAAWQGERVEIETSFAVPQPKPEPRIARYLAGGVDSRQAAVGKVGVEARAFWGLSGVLEAEGRLPLVPGAKGMTPTLTALVKRRF